MTTAATAHDRALASTPDGASLTWGDRVRYERERRGWSQQHLADLALCSPAAISRLERGARRTSDAVRVRVAKALGVSSMRLFPYEDAPALPTARRGVRQRRPEGRAAA